MKFLVLGCNGMAGHMISLYLKERGHEVFGFDRATPLYVNGVAGDARNTESLRDIIVNGKYDSVINCIGILNQFAEDSKSLASLNLSLLVSAPRTTEINSTLLRSAPTARQYFAWLVEPVLPPMQPS